MTQETPVVRASWKNSDFEFDLPKEQFSVFPPTQRGEARLLVLHRRSGAIEHRRYADLSEYLGGRTIYVNNSGLRRGWVKLYGTRGGFDAKAYLIAPAGFRRWMGLFICGPSAIGARYALEDGTRVRIEQRTGSNRYVFSTDRDVDLDRLGNYLLPPRGRLSREIPREWVHQALYTREAGSIAAPTAGIHLTPGLLSRLHLRELTLHTRNGYYDLPEGNDYSEREDWEPEEYIIPEPPKGSVVAIGTTVVKALETWARTGKVQGSSSLFIQPPFEFRAVDALVTNLHRPRQTLLLLTCAFGGHDSVMNAYREALRERYQFGYYGDLMLIL